jgi:hypothetical protein
MSQKPLAFNDRGAGSRPSAINPQNHIHHALAPSFTGILVIIAQCSGQHAQTAQLFYAEGPGSKKGPRNSRLRGLNEHELLVELYANFLSRALTSPESRRMKP